MAEEVAQRLHAALHRADHIPVGIYSKWACVACFPCFAAQQLFTHTHTYIRQHLARLVTDARFSSSLLSSEGLSDK